MKHSLFYKLLFISSLSCASTMFITSSQEQRPAHPVSSCKQQSTPYLLPLDGRMRLVINPHFFLNEIAVKAAVCTEHKNHPLMKQNHARIIVSACTQASSQNNAQQKPGRVRVLLQKKFKFMAQKIEISGREKSDNPGQYELLISGHKKILWA